MRRSGGNAAHVFPGGTLSVVVQGRNITVRLPRDAADAVRGLPAGPAVFTGRDGELAHAAYVFAPLTPDGSLNGRVVSVVTGATGVGKSALALKVAHDLVAAGWFTGGAVFVALHGHGAGDHPGPDAITARLLGSLGVPDEAIPADAPARTAAVRAVLTALADAGHRVLIVLDDVSSGDQVGSVLPGSEAHPVLLTARHTLTDLDAHTTELHPLPEPAAERR
ncbi:ATP-binding protein [Streptomyces sp. SID3343]|uniref:ATP-binding protein n=1 Tax=Streptomyces sp. SID3343 TaxID=2690260 RepID=UPI00136D6176|nr:ATP-binding protein [Streptomyces sp. SID3343]MYW01856.1 hypothetical protein [Streptomyces sp. SID3343]